MRYLLSLVCFLGPCAAVALAQTGPSLLLKPWAKQRAVEATADALFFDQTSIEGGGEDFGLTVYESYGRVRILPGNEASPRLGWDYYHLEMDADDGRLPDRLVDQSLSAGLFVAKVEGWIAGITVGAGYAGDTPFSDGHAWYGKGTAFVGKGLTKNTGLVLAVDYDGNRTFLPDVPLPGFAYTFKADRDLQVIVGLPINALTWEPKDGLRVELTWTLTDRFDGRVAYDVSKQWTVFGRFETRSTGFHLDELEASNDRILFHQRRAEAGVTWNPKPMVRVLVAGGYAFEQEFTVGWDSREDEELAELDDAAYVRFGVEVRW